MIYKIIQYLYVGWIVILLSCQTTEMTTIAIPEEVLSPEDTSLLQEPATMQNTLRYLALGDSYTIGESVASERNYPNQLVSKLQENEVAIAPPRIIAQTGWTTDELQAAINEATLDPPYDIVSLLIGVNNQFRGYDTAVYEKEFTALLEQAIQFAGGDSTKVFVVSIPDYAFTPFGQRNEATAIAISEGIDTYNAINKSVTDAFGIVYYDITPISRKGVEQPDLVATDKLHPSGDQYGLWVELICEDTPSWLP